MAIFKRKTPVQTLQGQLDELRSRAALLCNKLDIEKAALKSAVSARDHYMISGDLADERLGQKLQAEVKSCTSNVSEIQVAIGTLETHIEALERELEAEEQAAERSAASEKLAADVAAIEAELPRFVEAARMLADRLGQIGWYFDAAQMATYLGNACNEVELASAFSLAELKRMAISIREGTQPIPNGMQPIGNADRMPSGVAKEIFAAMPRLGDRDEVEIIRARMIARQHAYDRAALERSFGARNND
jgi:hypothetical protein